MWGNFGAAVSPKFFGLFLGAAGIGAASDWESAFVACATVNALAVLAAFGMDGRQRLRSRSAD
jgi:nitrate/nitrite transporter NarK